MPATTENMRRYRARHPERARLQKKIDIARQTAARRVAQRYPAEYEKAIQDECRRRGIPRFVFGDEASSA